MVDRYTVYIRPFGIKEKEKKIRMKNAKTLTINNQILQTKQATEKPNKVALTANNTLGPVLLRGAPGGCLWVRPFAVHASPNGVSGRCRAGGEGDSQHVRG